MNISIPDDLRDRMKVFDGVTNWSDLAADAFRRKVEDAEFLAGIKSKVKQRLAATEIEDLGGVEAFARQKGRDWAADHARKAELRRLSKHVEEDGSEFSSWSDLVEVILGDTYGDKYSDWFNGGQFAEGVNEDYEDTYAAGFAEGALGLLEEIDKTD